MLVAEWWLRSCFEESMLCQGLKAQHGVKLDIATVIDYKGYWIDEDGSDLTRTERGTQLLTEGLATKADGELESQEDKSVREEGFPFELLQLGWSIETTTAQAYVPADFNRIINTINGVPAEQLSTVEPDLGHEACERVNRMLRAVFAEAAAGKAAEQPGMLEQAMELLAKDTERTELMLDFYDCWKLTDVSAVGSGVSQLKSLQQLTLNFIYCRSLVDVSAVGSAISQLKSLQQLTLNFRYCEKLTDVSAVGSAVSQLKSLEQLTLNFRYCEKLTDVSAVGSGVGQLKSLQQLTLNFDHCSSLTDMSAVGSGVSQLKSLQKLTLDFRAADCSKLTGMCCFEARLRIALPGAEIEVYTEGTSSCCCRCTIC